MSPTASVPEVPKKRPIYDLQAALKILTLSSKDLHPVWRSQAKLFEPVYPDAEHILRKVDIPPTLTDHKRIKAYIPSISITPAGNAFAPQCSEIIPGRLWVADHYSGTDVSILERLNITHVVCIGHGEYHLSCPRLPTTVHLPVSVPIDTHGVPLVGIIDDAIASIRGFYNVDQAHRVLIHCAMGMTWSPSIATAYVMDAVCCCYKSALDFVQSVRTNTRPDPMVEEAIQQWSTPEQLRPEFPIGRGYCASRFASKQEIFETEGRHESKGQRLENEQERHDSEESRESEGESQ